MTSRVSLFMSAAATTVMLATSAYAQPVRDPEPHSVDNEDDLFEFMKLKLTQLHPNRPAWIVTSSDGERFTTAELRNGLRSPWRVRSEFMCPVGGQAENPLFFTSPGQVRDLTLYGIGFPDLLSWDEGDPELKNANEGAIEVSLWDNNYAQDAWLESEQERIVEFCNDAAEKVQNQNPGMSRRVAMSRVGAIFPYLGGASGSRNAVFRPSLRGRCVQGLYEDDPQEPGIGPAFIYIRSEYSDGDTDEQQLRLAVQCKAPLRPVEPAADSLVGVFGVTNARLSAQPVFVKGTCPREVKFEGQVSGSGSGLVRYRIRGSGGDLSPVRSINVTSAHEPATFVFTRTFGDKATGGLVTPTEPTSPPAGQGSLAIPMNPPDPAGPRIAARPSDDGPTTPTAGASSLANETAEGEISGWMRIEIVSPAAGVKKSREAHYKVICQEDDGPAISAVTQPQTREPLRRRDNRLRRRN